MNTSAFLLSLLGLAGGTYLMRYLGVRLGALTRDSENPGSGNTARLWMDRATVVLIFGVASTAMLFEGYDFAGFARLAGVVAGVGAAFLRVPMLLAVILGMAVCAGLRLAGIA